MFCTLIILCKLEMCHSRAIIFNTFSVCVVVVVCFVVCCWCMSTPSVENLFHFHRMTKFSSYLMI